MKYFIDTEFIDDGKTIDLISIGIVSSDGREYYAQSVEFDPTKASDWVRENVFEHLHICPWLCIAGPKNIAKFMKREIHAHHPNGQCIDQIRGRVHNCPWRTRWQIKQDILTFMDIATYGPPELYGYYSAYDHVVFCQLFGSMVDLPQGFPMLTYDLRQWLDMHGKHDVCQPDSIHNALEDAHWIARTHKDLVR